MFPKFKYMLRPRKWQRLFILSVLRLAIVLQICLYTYFVAQFLISLLILRQFNVGLGLLFITVDTLFIIACMDHFNQETYDREHLKEASALTILSIANELRDKRSTACARSFLQGWMFDTPIENISKQDLGEWISGMVFHKYVDELDYNQQIKVKSLIEEYESIIGMELNETGTTRKINLFLDRFQICFRPIIYYSVCYTLGLLAKYSFTTSHFDFEDLRDIIVYKRQGIDNQAPLVLFHGFGIGLLPYVPFVDGLIERFPNRTIILFELKCLSMRMNLDFILPEQFASKAVGFLAKHQITEIFAIGHSFGTACICWLDQHSPNLVSSRLFIDPICFALWTPDIARNFIYRSVNKFR